jgi:large subunit ribosomal protein L1
MLKSSKRYLANATKVIPGKTYALDEALNILKSCQPAKFNESVDVCVNLGVDPRKSDQMVRGSVVLPHGTGRTVRVAVFAEGEAAAAATAAGADIVGFQDLADKIKQGTIDFDVAIAAPDAMRVVGQLAQILGPRGLMPNPKVGTVTPDVAGAVKNAKAGQVQYRMDKGGVLHTTVGKINFTLEALKENLLTFITDVKRLKPATVKGIYLKKVVLTTTMGPAVIIDQSTIGA